MATRNINGVNVHFETYGDEAAPGLLLMHSIGTSGFIWQDVAERLSVRYRVLCPDFRGHGGTRGGAGARTIKDLADDMAALCAVMGFDRLHIGGLSLGGLVAQQLAIDLPDLVASLILCDTGLSIPPAAMWLERAETVRANGVDALEEAVFDRWITPTFAATPKGRQLREVLSTTSSSGYADAAQAIASACFAGRMGSLAVPTLVVVGSEDKATPPALAKELAEAIAGAQLHLVPGARHIPSLEHPNAVADAIAKFLNDVPLSET